jgi:aryl-alcohol dehydrogenase-like predicted oxidoreductase
MRLGLGLAALGRPAYINLQRDLGEERSREALRARTHAVLDAAYAAGIRYFDAARSYGLAEAFLGSWLRERDVRPRVGSKWGYTYTAGWRMDAEQHEVKDLRAATFRRQLAETRAELGDFLSLYQIHSATLESGVLEDEEVLGELTALRATGVAVGVTVTGARQAETIDAAVAAGGFDAVQATWNLHERSAGGALARAGAAGMEVIVKEAVANGRLAGEAAPAALRAAARELGTTPDALAIAVALAQPWVGVVLSGASSVPMLESNLDALRLAPDAGAFAQLSEPADAYWSARSQLPWT